MQKTIAHTAAAITLALIATAASAEGVRTEKNISLDLANQIAAHTVAACTANGHNVTAEPVAGVGGVEDINGVTGEQSYHLAQPDPYEGKYSTDVPAGVTCTAFNNASKTAANGKKKPGCYTSWSNGSADLEPGVYYLDNTTIDMQGNDVLTGTGVTLIFTGTAPGHIELNGNSKIVLTAPTDTTCGVRRMTLGVRVPVTTMSPPSGGASVTSAPGVEISTSSSACAASAGVEVWDGEDDGALLGAGAVPCAHAAGAVSAEERSSRLPSAVIFMSLYPGHAIG